MVDNRVAEDSSGWVLFGALVKGGIAKVSVNLDGDGLTVSSETETVDEAVPA